MKIDRRQHCIPCCHHSPQDFKGYSDALRGADIVWSEHTLNAFLRDSVKLFPGNAMGAVVQHMPDARDRRDLKLRRRQDRSSDLC